MENLTLNSNVTLKEAYLIMFDYLVKHWETTGKNNEMGALLGELSLWKTSVGKQPMDSSGFPRWLACATNVLEQEQTNGGYTKIDIHLTK